MWKRGQAVGASPVVTVVDLLGLPGSVMPSALFDVTSAIAEQRAAGAPARWVRFACAACAFCRWEPGGVVR